MTSAASRRALVLRCTGSVPPSARELAAVAAVVGEFCPWVEVLAPNCCAIGVRGPARYFGGEAELATRIVAAVQAAGFDCRAGIADGLFTALLAAAGVPTAGSSDVGPTGAGRAGAGLASPGGLSLGRLSLGRLASGGLALS